MTPEPGEPAARTRPRWVGRCVGLVLCWAGATLAQPAQPEPADPPAAEGPPPWISHGQRIAHLEAQLEALAGEAWLGLRLRPDPKGDRSVVQRVDHPALIAGDVQPDDRLIAWDGEPVSHGGLQRRLEQAEPGQAVRLTFRRHESKATPPKAASAKNPRQKPADREPAAERTSAEGFTVRLSLGAKRRWVGPLAFTSPLNDPQTYRQRMGLPAEPTRLERFIRGHLADQGLTEPVGRVRDYIAQTDRGQPGYHTPPALRLAMQRPGLLPSIGRAIQAPLGDLAEQPLALLPWLARQWGLPPPEPEPVVPLPLTDPPGAVLALRGLLDRSQQRFEQALAEMPREHRSDLAARLVGCLQRLLGRVDARSGDPQGRLAAMRASMWVDRGEQLAAARVLAGPLLMDRPEPERLADFPAEPLPERELPPAVRAAVEGPILAFDATDPAGLIVFGGVTSNQYDMSRLAGVIDLGGQDVYRYPATPANAVLAPFEGPDTWRPATARAVLDLAGDDRHVMARPKDQPIGEAPLEGQRIGQATLIGGPASAVLGLSVLVDLAGDDQYRGGDVSCGATLGGVALLVDGQGADRYEAGVCTQGAAFYGAAAALDLGPGDDRYTAKALAQGVGGPGGGIGLLLNVAGGEVYRAVGELPSAYGRADSSLGLSQGLAIGLRPHDGGGLGVLADLAGADDYQAGEFSQGGGYFLGFGLLLDRRGHDSYRGDRYCQGFGCHRGVGLLREDQGDDAYFGRVAANQGAGWDRALGLLLDRRGNDTYRGKGLTQGSAAMQAIGWLIDTAGQDRYHGPQGRSQGVSGPNFYHYQASGALSWSMLLDAGGGRDVYPPGRGNDRVRSTGRANERRRGLSSLYGLFIDWPNDLPADE